MKLRFGPSSPYWCGDQRGRPAPSAERGGADRIKAAILEYKVVFFRGQDLDQDQHAAFAAQFGPLCAHPHVQQAQPNNVTAIHRIAAADTKEYEKVRDLRDTEGWDAYHTDTSWRVVADLGARSAAVNLPRRRGRHGAGWTPDLPTTTCRAMSRTDWKVCTSPTTTGPRSTMRVFDYPIVAHPIVRVHRQTGKRILWVNFTQRPWIIGLDRAEGRELLSLVQDQYRKPEHQVRFSWRPGSVAFWDNRAAVHYAVRNYGDFPRLLERILIADEPQYADL